MVTSLDGFPLFLTPDQMSDLTGSDRKTVYKAIHDGQIPVVRLGKKILISRLVVEKMLSGSQG